MTIRNKSRKNKPRVFNIVDVAIVFVVALMLFYIVYVSILGHSLSDLSFKKLTVQYTLVIENADYSGYSTLSVGESVMSKDGNTDLGKITELSFLHDENGYGTAKIIVESTSFLQKSDVADQIKKDNTLIILGEDVSVRFAEYSPSSGVKCTDIKVK